MIRLFVIVAETRETIASKDGDYRMVLQECEGVGFVRQYLERHLPTRAPFAYITDEKAVTFEVNDSHGKKKRFRVSLAFLSANSQKTINHYLDTMGRGGIIRELDVVSSSTEIISEQEYFSK